MRILMISQYFTPEITAAPMRLEPFARGLAERGHEVRVVCEAPSHPGGVVHDGYGGHAIDRRNRDGYAAEYVWTFARPSASTAVRLSSYATYTAMATVAGSRGMKPDVIFASSPPLTVGVTGAVLARRHRVPWVLDVRDLWPEVAGAVGRVGSGRVIRAAERLERRLYRDAAAVTSPTEPFRDHILAKRGRPGVELLPNGTSDIWLDGAGSREKPEDLGLPPGFLLTYAGNVGLSQGVEVAVEAIRSLGDGHNLLIVGGGAGREAVEAAAAGLPPGRVTIREPLPPAELLPYLRASSALLVSLADNPALGKTIPVKLYDYAAVGTPVIVAAPGEAARIAAEGDIAAVAAPGDPASLADAVRGISADPAAAHERAARARKFASEHRRGPQVERLEEVLADVARRE